MLCMTTTDLVAMTDEDRLSVLCYLLGLHGEDAMQRAYRMAVPS